MLWGVLDWDLPLDDPFPLLEMAIVPPPPPDIRDGFSGAPPVPGALPALAAADCAEDALLLLEPPHNTLVTRSITLVFSPDLLLPLLWWCLERSPRPLMRFESSAEARSTTP